MADTLSVEGSQAPGMVEEEVPVPEVHEERAATPVAPGLDGTFRAKQLAKAGLLDGKRFAKTGGRSPFGGPPKMPLGLKVRNPNTSAMLNTSLLTGTQSTRNKGLMTPNDAGEGEIWTANRRRLDERMKATLKGVKVVSVTVGSPAYKGDLREGDLIVAIDGVPLEDKAHFQQIFEEPAKSMFRMKVKRFGMDIICPVKLMQYGAGL